jgi:LacI family transcriptional regulator
MGKKVPEDVAVIGFNDDPICEIVDPPLSSMYHPPFEMGKICFSRIIHTLNETKQSEDLSVLATELIPRKSSLRKS